MITKYQYKAVLLAIPSDSHFLGPRLFNFFFRSSPSLRRVLGGGFRSETSAGSIPASVEKGCAVADWSKALLGKIKDS